MYWFTVKVKYTKQQDNGTFKRVSEPYLLSAVTFGDAETRIYKELGEIIRGEFQVVAITRTELHDIFSTPEADMWYDAKIVFDGSTDEGKSKKVRQTFLVAAASVEEADKSLKEALETGLLVDFEITHVSKSPIVDIFPHVEELDKEISRTPAE